MVLDEPANEVADFLGELDDLAVDAERESRDEGIEDEKRGGSHHVEQVRGIIDDLQELLVVPFVGDTRDDTHDDVSDGEVDHVGHVEASALEVPDLVDDEFDLVSHDVLQFADSDVDFPEDRHEELALFSPALAVAMCYACKPKSFDIIYYIFFIYKI